MVEKTKSEKLAIDGGNQVRTKALPWELPGSNWIGQEEKLLVNEVIDAKSPFRFYGPDLKGMVDKLEQEFKEKYARKYALAVSSGTAALNTVFGALGLGPGDEVLLPGYFWVSCVNSLVHLGIIPRLVDIDETFCMSPEDLKTKITPNSKAILLVHMSGAPGKVDEIARIAKENNLKLVEDCAQASGAYFKGKRVGGFGDLAMYSFQLNKNMTCGEGGILTCDDESLYDRCFSIHDLGYARTDGRLDTTKQDCQLWGIGARMSELSGAMALAQLRKLDDITAAMRNAKWKIRKELSDIKGLTFRRIMDPQGDSGPFLIFSFDNAFLCKKFTEALKAEGLKGPEESLACLAMEDWGLHWHFNNPSLVNKRSISRDGFPWTHPANSFALEYDYSRGTLPNCDDFAGRSGLLTIASCLTDDDLNDIIAAFKKVAANIL